MSHLFLFDPTAWHDWKDWLGGHGARIAFIVVLLGLADLLFRRVVSRWLLSAISRAARVRHEDSALVRRRADTLASTLNWAFGIFLAFLGTGLVLSEIGLNVSALIAGVGVVGIALGLGAQTLVKDVLNGLFILIEDQYAVGDLVTVAGSTGQVIEINPRRTVIRDGDGNLHSIPNSAISVAINRTPSLNRFKVEIDVPFRDSDRAAAAANEVCRETAKELDHTVLVAPVVVAQTMVGDGDVRLLIVGDALANARWQVESELRRRLKRRFDAERLDARFEREAGG
jgi:small conductance mechanosensitive channel